MTATADRTDSTTNGLPQERRLVTSIPGPRSQALQARKTAAVSAGVGVTLPVYVAKAGGGVLLDVDGNSLIDMGSGIAVTTVGNANPEVVAGRAAAGGGVHPHLLHGHPLRRVRRGVRGPEPAHPR